MAEILHCPICSNAMAAVKSWLYRYNDCGFLQSNLRPGADTGIEGLEDLRRANFEQLLDQMRRFDPPAGRTLLEVGCAKGWFLEAATARGFTVFGLEPEAAKC